MRSTVGGVGLRVIPCAHSYTLGNIIQFKNNTQSMLVILEHSSWLSTCNCSQAHSQDFQKGGYMDVCMHA